VLRTLFLIVLMAIIPVRGAIGSGMMLCGPVHDHPATATVIAGAPAHDGHGGPAPAWHDHGARLDSGGHHDHDRDSPARDHDHDETGAAHAGAHACSLCAECCGGAIILSSALTVPAIAHDDDLFPPVVVYFERRPPDGLERPPHLRLV
jgi:hypothetical protein